MAVPPLQLLALWNLIQGDITLNGNLWVVSRRNRTLYRNPNFVAAALPALGIPPGFGGIPAYRIVVRAYPGTVASFPPPAVDNQGRPVLHRQINEHALPPTILTELGASQPQWFDIDHNLVP